MSCILSKKCDPAALHYDVMRADGNEKLAASFYHLISLSHTQEFLCVDGLLSDS